MTAIIRAAFDDPTEAREVMYELEGIGIDAVDIKLLDDEAHVPPTEVVREADDEIITEIAEHYGAGAIVGGVIGAVVAMVIVAIIGLEPLGFALLLAAAMGGSAGFFFGGFFNVARKLPVNEDAYDPAVVVPAAHEPLHVEVRVEDARVLPKAEDVIRAHHPIAVHRE